MNAVAEPRPAFRFAPSPNGRLHLGHAYSALLNADLAARLGGRLLLRIEDIDPARSRPDLIAAIESDLAWLGLTFAPPVRRQSQHMPAYRAVLDGLVARGLAYPCFCTRGDIRAATLGTGARDPDGAPLYPGTCRTLDPAIAAARRAAGEPHAWRLDMAGALGSAPGPHGYTDLAPFPPPEAGDRIHPSRDGDGGGAGPLSRAGKGQGEGYDLSGRTWVPHPNPLPPGRGGHAAVRTIHPALALRSGNPVACAGEGGPRAKSGEGSAVSGEVAPLSRPSPTRGLPSPASGGGRRAFHEAFRSADPARWGDAVIARRDVPTSYHLAVVIDDAAQAITHVVRGRDLEAATDLHVLLQALLGLATPVYHHHALILGADGEKLAKSKGSESLADLRARGEGQGAGQGAGSETIRAALGFS